MNHLISHIEYLVMRHDCVVVPGWGAFVSHRRPAYYDEDSQRFEAPRRELSFNSDIVHADGLIASSISRREGISFEQASLMVARETEAMKSQLASDGELSLGRIGRFLAQKDASPLFETSPRMERSFASMFPALEIKTLAARIKEEKEIEEATRPIGKRTRLKRFGIKAVKAAASIVIAAGIGIGLIAPIVKGREDRMAAVSATASTFVSNSQTSIVAPAAGKRELLISVPPVASVSLSDSRHEAVTPVETVSTRNTEKMNDHKAGSSFTNESAAEVPVREITSGRSAQSLRFSESDPYCLIVASLPTRDGADRYMRETKGEFGVLEQDGKFRVYVATGTTSASTLAQRSGDIAARFPDAWVCRRK